MEANDFIARLKANGKESDLVDLQKAYDEFKVISRQLGAKDKGPFALNVLCIICRNLDKVPTWKGKVDSKLLLTLSIDCVRETRSLTRPDQVKTLACMYHIHKHVVKFNTSIPPELILKLSYMPFECDTKDLLQEYCKTYWNILADRMSYMERLKTKVSISKLLPKLIGDILKIIPIYDSVQLCSNFMTFLVKKLHYLYNDTNACELHKYFGDIFKVLSSKTDLGNFKKLSEKEILDMYMKFSDCFYVVAENASKIQFKDCNLNVVIRTAITVLGHNPDIMRCLETFFLNGFYSIFENLSNITNIENVLNNMLASCVSIENLGCEKSMYATYPFLNQFLRLLIEYTVNCNNNWNINFNNKIQICCLNLMLYLSTKKTEQILKCDNCKVKSSLHDSLRLLFLIKHFPSISINQNIDISGILPIYYKLVNVQHKILCELKRLGCVNHEKCFRKLQTDIHNTAIVLNKAQYFEYSIRLFDVYVELEMRYIKNETELKNVSRALYNKSICELDYKLYDEALRDAFLSLIFSLPDGLASEKFMSLVMDVKAKALKANEDGCTDEFQMVSVLKACELAMQEKKYGNLKPFLCNIKFSELLKHEFAMYGKLWPSIVPIAGVWRSLNDLRKNNVTWLKAENQEILLWTLYKMVLATPIVVRTIHSEYYTEIVTELLEEFEDKEPSTPDLAVIQASLLFLKCEYDLAEASQKYGWKVTEPSMDPDQIQSVRTLPQEHEAIKKAIQAVDILTDLVKNIDTVPKSKHLCNSLQVYQVFVQQLLLLYRTVEALQLAYICCTIAEYVGDSEVYIINAGVVLSHADSSSPELLELVTTSSSMFPALSVQASLLFLCDVAIHYSKCGSKGVSARLVQIVQGRVLKAYEEYPEINLDLCVGRLTEAQAELCSNTSIGSISAIQRHYLAITNTETKWSRRRYLGLTLKHRIGCASVGGCSRWVSVGVWRRARSSAAVALPVAYAALQAKLLACITNSHYMDDAQTKIDNRLKHILGLQPSNDPQSYSRNTDSKPQFFTPKHDVEIMLENMVLKKNQSSPSLPCTSVPAFKMADFFTHENCTCYACENPYTLPLACLTSGLEASMYYRAKEYEIARNYFEGTLKCFCFAENKLNRYFKSKNKYEAFVVNMCSKIIIDDFRKVQIGVLIEAAFFELSQSNNDKADDLIVRIHEIVEINKIDPYLKNEIMNLMTASAQVRKAVIKPVETGLEFDMETLKLSPDDDINPPKTPVTKPLKPPKLTKNVAKNEEIPNLKRKVIKLNLEEVVEEKQVTKPGRKRAEFKIPVPVTAKPVLESITPRVRSKPDILITKPAEESKETPKVEAEFYTPISTPSEQFFTPMTSIKTYSKKSLRHNIVKNLEAEFSTPKGDKENAVSNSDAKLLEVPQPKATRSKVDKKVLKRAVSPGKLTKDKPTRSSRLRNPINFNIHKD